MKGIACFVLALVMALGLCACGQKADTSVPAESAPTWQDQYDLGIRYLSEGNYKEAIIAFTAAIEIDPRRADAYIGLADIYSAQGDLERAIQTIEDAISALGDTEDPKLLEYLESLMPQAEVVGTAADSVFGTLELSDVSYVYDPNSEIVAYNEGSVGGLEFAFTVNGPASVRTVWISSWLDLEFGGYTQEIIADEIPMVVEIWKNSNSNINGGQLPPFSVEGEARPVAPEEIGQTQQTLLIGLDENMNAVGYAVVTTTIPG